MFVLDKTVCDLLVVSRLVPDAEGLGEGFVQSEVSERSCGVCVCERISDSLQSNSGEWRGHSYRPVSPGTDPQPGGPPGGLCAQPAALENQQDAQ